MSNPDYRIYRQSIFDRGFCLVENFIDIQQLYNEVLGLSATLIDHHGIDLIDDPKVSLLSNHINSIAKHDRAYLSHFYNAIKSLPGLAQVVACNSNIDLLNSIYPGHSGSHIYGPVHGGAGIRINMPDEEQYLADWHQDFTTQMLSTKGFVFWIPLVDVDLLMGPVVLLDRSHKLGPKKIIIDPSRKGNIAYKYKIAEISDIVEHHQEVVLTFKAGDLLLMDYNLIHRSGFNQSLNPLVSVQYRYALLTHDSALSSLWPMGVHYSDYDKSRFSSVFS